MFCKYCGEKISDDSRFCQHCGGKIDIIDCSGNTSAEPVKIKLAFLFEVGRFDLKRQIKYLQKICSEYKSLISAKLGQLYSKHKVIAVAYCIWSLVNIMMLIIGGSEKGFWPNNRTYVYTTVATTPYNKPTQYSRPPQFRNDFAEGIARAMRDGYRPVTVTEETKLDWDLCYYGWTEFFVYMFAPLILIYLVLRLKRMYRIKKHLRELNDALVGGASE
ncbi:MAG: zinc ribbon domain-containing protein [Muribaculum sp.]|nr:zinc ribbon domain-containing protein [Muribaculum sp.]